MKIGILLVIICVLLCTCNNRLHISSKEELLEQKNRNNLLISFDVELPDTVYRDQHNIPIILKVENLAPEPIVIRDPRYWGNCLPYILYGKKDVVIIKVKVNPDVFKKTVRIEGQGTFSTSFSFSLDEIMDLENAPFGQYEVYFILSEVKSMKSQICTFYVADDR